MSRMGEVYPCTCPVGVVWGVLRQDGERGMYILMFSSPVGLLYDMLQVN